MNKIFCGLGLAALATSPVLILTHSAAAQGAAPSATAGKQLFRAKCATCHSDVKGKASPIAASLHGVVGRRAGTVPSARYSAKMKAANISWTAANIDKYLAGPQAMVPGTTMATTVRSAKERQDIVAYLATLK